jgi:hypothetical protein
VELLSTCARWLTASGQSVETETRIAAARSKTQMAQIHLRHLRTVVTALVRTRYLPMEMVESLYMAPVTSTSTSPA